MKIKLRQSLVPAFIAVSAMWSPAGMADPAHQNNGLQASGLVEQVQDATRRYRDLNIATSEGYGLFLGCVSGPDEGAMGVHYANGALVEDNVLDAEQPEVLVYAPRADGTLRLAAVEFLVLADGWHVNNTNPPVLSGQSFHYSGTPNRYGLPAFYSLHVWAWKQNPHGEFVNWNPNVSCKNYAPQTP